jgi:recombination protein RecT
LRRSEPVTDQPKAELTAPEAPKSTAIASMQKKAETVKTMLESYRPQLAAALPAHLSVDRMIRVALTEGQRPEILKCHVGSFIGAVLLSAQLGLELGSSLGQAYLVPFWNNKTKRDEVQLIPGYRGLVHLVRQTGQVDKFAAHIVYSRDTFDLTFGIVDSLVHRPFIAKAKAKNQNPGPIIGAYAIVAFKSGTPQFEWMSVAELDLVRARSKAATKGPWVTDYPEMCRKTVAKRLAKWLPMSTQLATAMDLDNKHEIGEAQVLPEVKVTSLPAVALIEAPDPVLEAYGSGGDEEEAVTEVEATVSAPAPEETGKTDKPTESAPETADEGLFRNLLASLDESEDFSDLERRVYRALTAAGENKFWQKEVKAAVMRLEKRFPRPKETTR